MMQTLLISHHSLREIEMWVQRTDVGNIMAACKEIKTSAQGTSGGSRVQLPKDFFANYMQKNIRLKTNEEPAHFYDNLLFLCCIDM